MAGTYNERLKIILIGDCHVGKSSLIARFSDNIFSDEPLKLDKKHPILEMNDKIYKLEIWDTAGQERFRETLPTKFYKDAMGILLVFDVTDEMSFNSLNNWRQYIDRYSDRSDVFIMLVGNKIDLTHNRAISTKKAQDFASTVRLDYMETSAKDATNVEAAFRNLVAGILKMREPPVILPNDIPSFRLPTSEKPSPVESKKKKCC